MHPAGDQVVSRTLRRTFGKHGGLDIDEALSVKKLAHLHGHLVAKHQVVLHVRTAQVQHAVHQPGGLGEVLVIELKRGGD